MSRNDRIVAFTNVAEVIIFAHSITQFVQNLLNLPDCKADKHALLGLYITSLAFSIGMIIMRFREGREKLGVICNIVLVVFAFLLSLSILILELVSEEDGQTQSQILFNHITDTAIKISHALFHFFSAMEELKHGDDEDEECLRYGLLSLDIFILLPSPLIALFENIFYLKAWNGFSIVHFVFAILAGLILFATGCKGKTMVDTIPEFEKERNTRAGIFSVSALLYIIAFILFFFAGSNIQIWHYVTLFLYSLGFAFYYGAEITKDVVLPKNVRYSELVRTQRGADT